MKMNMSQYRKVHEDDKTATFAHTKGHKIQVDKSALSPKMKAQLSALPLHMADGGEAFKSDVADDISFDSAKKPKSSSSVDDTAETEPKPEPVEDKFAYRKEGEPMMQAVGRHVGEGITGGIQGTAGALGQVFGPVVNGVGQFIKGATGDEAEASINPGSQVPSNYQIAPPQASGNSPELQGNSSQSQSGGVGDYEKAFGQYNTGVRGYAEALGKQGDQEAQQYAAQQNELSQRQQIHQKTMDDLNSERAKFVKDLDEQHFDTNRYINSMPNGQKVMTAIGLLISGFGSGISGQSNMAYDFLKGNIDRDIESQKLNFGKTKTLLEANQQQQMNARDAELLARSQIADIYSAKIKQIGAQSQRPEQKALADQLAAKFQMEYSLPMLQRVATLNALQSGGKVNPEMLPAEQRERLVMLPNGQARLAPTKTDAEDSRKTIGHLTNMDKNLSELETALRQGGRVVNPFSDYASTIAQKRANIMLGVGQLHGLSRMSDVDLKMYDKMTPTGKEINLNQAFANIKEQRKQVQEKLNDELSSRLGGPVKGMSASSKAGPAPKIPPNYPRKR